MELKSVNELYFYERARLWKRAAKTWRGNYYYLEAAHLLLDKSDRQAKADADRRRELLEYALEFLEEAPMTLQNAALKLAIAKELADAES